MQRFPFDLWRLIVSDLFYFTPLLKGKQLVQYPELIRKMSKRAREESRTKICHRGKSCPVGRPETSFSKGGGVSLSTAWQHQGQPNLRVRRFGETLMVCTVRAVL